MLRTSKLLDRAFDGSEIIFATNDRELFIAEMRSELSDVRSDSSEVCNTYHYTAPSPN
ncbi:hypothetical protein RHMOL_Rhmol04G0305100 [Rhododendron molle]|uniref:Uncharacterized protein n=1 Tax=Rhododendron molle TaxID=49168 RepID=A0ACC0P671_RHOML|nr:hypothetical protein RHMOL_Rhmol04G0305100 [Rhododendron molle]